MYTLQENPFSSTPPHDSKVTPSSQPKKKWIWIFGLIFLLILGITSYIYFVYLPEKETQEYVNKAEPIVLRLNEEVSNFKQGNFLSDKITTNTADVQTSLEGHAVNLSNTKNKIVLLHTEYTKLKPTGKTKTLDQLITEQFNLTESILDNYDKDLIFRKQEFVIFGGQLARELNHFDTLDPLSEKVNFIILTDKISNLAQQALDALSYLSVPDDEKEEFGYRKDYAWNIKIGFDKLNEYYRIGKDLDIRKGVNELNQKIAESNDKYPAIAERYISSSSVALGLKQFEDQSQQIQDYFQQYKKTGLIKPAVKETAKTQPDLAKEQAQGKILLHPKNGELKILDIATKKIALIATVSATGNWSAEISPDGSYVYYYVFLQQKYYSNEEPDIKQFIYDTKTGKNYLIHTENRVPLNAIRSKDSKALLFYSPVLGKDLDLKILKVSSKEDLENLVPKNAQLPPELVNLDYASDRDLSLINENEILLAADKKGSRDMAKNQVQEAINEANASGKIIKTIEDLPPADLNKITISTKLIKFNAFTGKIIQHLTMQIPIYYQLSHIGCWNFDKFTPDNNLVCTWEEREVGAEEGVISPEKIKIVLIDPTDFSIKKESEISEVDFDRSMQMPDITQLKDKVLIETEKWTLGSKDGYGNRKVISDSQKLFFRNLPDLTKDEKSGVVELQTISPNFDKDRGLTVEAISPQGHYMILQALENCQQPRGCEFKYYLYSFRAGKAALIYVEEDLNSVGRMVLTND